MTIFIVLVLITLAFYLFCMVTQKNISKAGQYSYLAEHIFKIRATAYTLLLICMVLLIRKFGAGIATVSLFVFMTPIIFLIILRVNNLSQNQKKRSSS